MRSVKSVIMASGQDQRPIAVSGPSGVGKGTLIAKLLECHPDTFATTISHTTRRPRPGEVDGKSYYFVNPREFETLIKDGAFIEYTTYAGNYYGTSRQTVQDQQAKGRIAVLDIEMSGVINIKKDQCLDVRYICIAPPSFQALADRLHGRGTESEDGVRKRLAQARAELDYSSTPGAYDLVMTNNELQDAFREFEGWALGVIKHQDL